MKILMALSLLRRARSGIWNLRSDQRGVSIIELAIAAPVFAILVVGISDLARGFSEQYFLQQAVNRTLELGHLGLQTNERNFNHLIPEAAAAAGVPETNVTLEHWLECNGIKVDFYSSCAPGDLLARYISLTIRSSFKPLFGTAGYPVVQSDGTVLITGKGSLRVQ